MRERSRIIAEGVSPSYINAITRRMSAFNANKSSIACDDNDILRL